MASSTIQAPKVITATESSTNIRVEGIESPEAIYQGNNEATAAGEGSFNDSGVFVECDESDESSSPMNNYNDFQLYDDDLPEIDPAMDRFFADADASTPNCAVPFYYQTNDSGVGLDAHNPTFQRSVLEATPFLTSLRNVIITDDSDAASDIVKPIDTPSQFTDVPAPHAEDNDVSLGPFYLWLGTPLRHERIAYLLFQQPQPAHEADT